MSNSWLGGVERQEDVLPAAEAFVREQRLTIAVVFPLVGSLLLVAAAESVLPPALAANPYLLLFGTAVMRLPLVVAIAPLVDRRAGAFLLGLSGFVYAVEFVGVTTGWPYGEFHYVRELGPMLLGTVPLGLPLFFLPLILDAYLLGLVVLGGLADRWPLRLGTVLALVLVVDLVLDPGAVAVEFWRYAEPGRYYGVPLSNYAGWLLSGGVAVVGVDRAFDRAAVRERVRECEFALDDLVSFVVFWTVVNVYAANWLPVVLALGLVLALVWTDG